MILLFSFTLCYVQICELFKKETFIHTEDSGMKYKISGVWCLMLFVLIPGVWLSTATSLNAQSSQPVDKSESAKTLIVKVDRKNEFGAGIIFNVSGGYLFIMTADHVIKGSLEGVEVEFEFLRGVPVKAERWGSSPNLDVAVLQVDIQNSRLRDVALDRIPFELLNENTSVKRQDSVFAAGHPAGDEWYIPMTTAKVRQVIFETEIRFEFSCSPGHSGGGLFSGDWSLAGMIIRNQANYCEAISFKRISATLEDDWGLEVRRERITSVSTPTPTPISTPTPSTSEIDRQKITRLLQTADAYFARKWYTTPAETNAFDIYLEVLKLDSTNAHAFQQIDTIAQFYKSRAEREVERGKTEQAVQYYRKYLTVVPDDEEILGKVAKLETSTAPPEAKLTEAPFSKVKEQPTPSEKVWTEPVQGMEFVWVPAGCFQMGSSETERLHDSDEEPIHKVCVDGLWMGKYEVTQKQWQQVMGENPANFNSATIGEDSGNHPVEQVSWEEVQEFIRRLNEKFGTNVYHLPSEAEWEYACRVGTTMMYGFGNDNSKLGQYAWYHENSENKTHPVGQLKPNVFGLHDMHGNVAEWCMDQWHEDYHGGPADGRAWETGDDTPWRVIRGGSWHNAPRYVRCANRGKLRYYDGNRDIGIRLVYLSGVQ